MDIESDVVATSLSRRPLTLPFSSPNSEGSSESSSPASITSYKCRFSQRSDSPATSPEGDDGPIEENVTHVSVGNPQNAVTRPVGVCASKEQLRDNGGIPRAVAFPNTHDKLVSCLPTSVRTGKVSCCPSLPNLAQSFPLKQHAGVPKEIRPVPLSFRQNPRRTPMRSNPASSNGSGPPQPRPPPKLIRQCERKDDFVECLIDVTTQTIETIWPLSAAHGMASADQNLFSLRTFVLEVLKRSKTSYSTLLVAIYYLVVIMSKLPSFDFTMEQMIDSDECRAMQCGRRMFLAALILASKYLQDRNYSTRAWGKISGLKPYEINTNERVFLEAVNWKLHLPEPLFHRWERIVLKYSPSGSAVNVPRSSPAACQTWRSIVRQLNADLDQFDNHGMLISDNDSAYYSESSPGSSRGTSPHAPRESGIAHISTDVTTAAPYSLLDLPPLTMEPPVQDSKPDNRMLPPLQPREGPLPTPQITPQFKGFCTPAVSASGLLPRRSSMSIAMTEHRRCFEERLLDRPYTWGPTSDATQRQFNRVPSSLSLASSPPDSILSDVSLYPSRSSSISSVASSNCALPEPCLASEAVRRCADMKMSALVDKYHLSEQGKVTDTAAFSRFPVSPRSCGNEFYFKERPKMPRGELINKSQGCNIGSGLGPKICSRAEGSIVSRVKMSIPTTTQIEANSDDSDDDATPKPRPAIAQDNASPTSRTYQAAAALVDLTLDQNPRPRRGREPPRVNSLKRGRTFSVDCELQSSVQGLLRPQSSRNTNPIGNRDTIVVIPDKAVADSRLSKGSHRSSPSHSEALWADFDRRCIDSEDETKNREVAEQLMKQHAQNSYQSVKSSSESSPRKKPCCSTRSLDPAQKLRHSEGGQSPPIQQGLSVRKGGGNVKPVRSRPTGQYKPKTRGSRKPAKEMEWLVRSGQADFAEMHDSALGGEGLLYGEVRSW